MGNGGWWGMFTSHCLHYNWEQPLIEGVQDWFGEVPLVWKGVY